jgi:hypothetical protein
VKILLLTKIGCPVLNLFIDWNPIYNDDYSSMSYDNTLYHKKTPEELSIFAKL